MKKIKLRLATKALQEKAELYGYNAKMSFLNGVEYHRKAMREYLTEIAKEDLTDGEVLTLVYDYLDESYPDLRVLYDELQEKKRAEAEREKRLAERRARAAKKQQAG